MSAINGRCGVSQQSIAEGDRCRVMFISQSSSFKPLELQIGDKTETQFGVANTTVYPNCFWRPESPFIKAVYDDYGMTKLVLETGFDRAQVATLFADIFCEAVNTRAGENRYHDHAFDFAQFVREQTPTLAAVFEPLKWHSPPVAPKEGELDADLQKCWDFLSDMVRRHRVFTRGYCNYIRPMEMFIVHERAYQALVDDMAARKNWDDVSYELHAYLRHALAKAREEVASGRLEQPDDDESRRAQARAFAFLETLRSEISRVDVDSCFTNRTARHSFDRDAGKVFKGELPDEDFIAKAAVWMRDRLAICGMEVFEIKFMPLTYVGADFKNSVGSAYAKFVAAVSDQVTQDRKKHND